MLPASKPTFPVGSMMNPAHIMDGHDHYLTAAQIAVLRSPNAANLHFPRCIHCSQVPVDAYKTPCCGKSVCADCVPRLSGACPGPTCDALLSPHGCFPNYGIRRHIRSWCIAQEKKLAEEQQQEAFTNDTRAQLGDVIQDLKDVKLLIDPSVAEGAGDENVKRIQSIEEESNGDSADCTMMKKIDKSIAALNELQLNGVDWMVENSKIESNRNRNANAYSEKKGSQGERVSVKKRETPYGTIYYAPAVNGMIPWFAPHRATNLGVPARRMASVEFPALGYGYQNGPGLQMINRTPINQGGNLSGWYPPHGGPFIWNGAQGPNPNVTMPGQGQAQGHGHTRRVSSFIPSVTTGTGPTAMPTTTGMVPGYQSGPPPPPPGSLLAKHYGSTFTVTPSPTVPQDPQNLQSPFAWSPILTTLPALPVHPTPDVPVTLGPTTNPAPTARPRAPTFVFPQQNVQNLPNSLDSYGQFFPQAILSSSTVTNDTVNKTYSNVTRPVNPTRQNPYPLTSRFDVNNSKQTTVTQHTRTPSSPPSFPPTPPINTIETAVTMPKHKRNQTAQTIQPLQPIQFGRIQPQIQPAQPINTVQITTTMPTTNPTNNLNRDLNLTTLLNWATPGGNGNVVAPPPILTVDNTAPIITPLSDADENKENALNGTAIGGSPSDGNVKAISNKFEDDENSDFPESIIDRIVEIE